MRTILAALTALAVIAGGALLLGPATHAQESNSPACSDFANQAAAQAYYRANPDAIWLDANADGLACEIVLACPCDFEAILILEAVEADDEGTLDDEDADDDALTVTISLDADEDDEDVTATLTSQAGDDDDEDDAPTGTIVAAPPAVTPTNVIRAPNTGSAGLR